jgi:hypothetical protein
MRGLTVISMRFGVSDSSNWLKSASIFSVSPPRSMTFRTSVANPAEYDLAQSQCCDTQQTMERDLDLDQHIPMPAEVYLYDVLGA